MATSSVIFPVDVDIRKYQLAMKIYKKDALPLSVAETLNRTAEAVTKQQIKNVKKDLTVRTKFTINSMSMRRARPFKALNKASGRDLDRMFSRAGTVSKYLWMQEEDFINKGMRGPIPIPTVLTRISKNEKKSIRKIYRLSRFQSLTDGPLKFLTTKGKEAGSGFVGKPKGRKQGMYVREGSSLKMLRNLEHDEAKTKGIHFHERALKRFGTAQFIKAQFLIVSKHILKRKGLQ